MSLSTTSPDTISTELFKINNTNNNININNNINHLNLDYLLSNKYIIAVLYIILFLYASKFAPKIPDWIAIYLENLIVKIIIVFIIGFLTTKDLKVAIIVTICLNVIFLLISENKITDSIKKFLIESNNCNNNKDNKDVNKEDNNKEDNKDVNKEKENFLQYLQSYQEYNPTINIENFSSKNELTNHSINIIEDFNNKNELINHTINDI
jgi:hypothetical protein